METPDMAEMVALAVQAEECHRRMNLVNGALLLSPEQLKELAELANKGTEGIARPDEKRAFNGQVVRNYGTPVGLWGIPIIPIYRHKLTYVGDGQVAIIQDDETVLIYQLPSDLPYNQ